MQPQNNRPATDESLFDILIERLESLYQEIYHVIISVPDAVIARIPAYTMLPAALQEYTSAVRTAEQVLPRMAERTSFAQKAVDGLAETTFTEVPLTSNLLELKSAIEPLLLLLADHDVAAVGGRIEELRWARMKLFDAGSAIDTVVAAEASTELQSILQGAKEAAGNVGEINLSAEFKAVADKEETQANIFRGLAIVMFPIALAVAVYILGKYSKAAWTNELIRLAVDVPILAAAFYFSSEARDHRVNSRKARELQVRLASVRAYTAELPEAERNQIRTALGIAIFREPTLTVAPQTISEMTDDVLKRVVEIVKAAKT